MIEVIEKPKRDSGYTRMRKKADYLAKDVVSLERLVATLLNHLERAIDPAVTDQERTQFHIMINEIRETLA
jgi:hypothetical protein